MLFQEQDDSNLNYKSYVLDEPLELRSLPASKTLTLLLITKGQPFLMTDQTEEKKEEGLRGE